MGTKKKLTPAQLSAVKRKDRDKAIGLKPRRTSGSKRKGAK